MRSTNSASAHMPRCAMHAACNGDTKCHSRYAPGGNGRPWLGSEVRTSERSFGKRRGQRHDGAHRIDHPVLEPHGGRGDGAPCAARRYRACGAAAHDRCASGRRSTRCCRKSRRQRPRSPTRAATSLRFIAPRIRRRRAWRARQNSSARCAHAGATHVTTTATAIRHALRRARRAPHRAADALQRARHRRGSRISARGRLRGAVRPRLCA